MRWVGRVARMVDGRGVCRVLVRSPECKRPLGRPRIFGSVTLKWILGRKLSIGRTELSWFWIGSSGRLL